MSMTANFESGSTKPKVSVSKTPLRWVGHIVLRIFLIIQALIVVYPLIWNVLASFKTNTEVMESPWSLPKTLNWENYVNAFTTARIGDYMLNSVLVVAMSMVILLAVALPTAYALGRMQFRGRGLITNLYMAGLFIGGAYIIVPLFILMNNLHMLDNRFWLSAVYATGSLSFSVYLMIGFMKSIPQDFEEAALIDGAGYMNILFRIILPITRPAIVTLVVFGFFDFWNEYVLALTLVTSDEKKTIPIGLANLMQIQQYATDWGSLFAGLVIVLIPTVIVYALLQKRLTEGMMMGGVKG
ncbi:carbohydrate ABC transporter permease [Paenibacillus sp. PsM32]|uniref:Carbohydrate ABC transporter permease n=1 Tax=Paenibacillus kyungheensis TaxID=1452732 RepID=A0AAX3M0M9_9BACL|nr:MULTISPECIES: carbohydrate ABC transporter permease [Paenibacillus]MDN4618601.1 carbohydrate ABC transporter permease [Paenibacillus sp. PsM32]MDQ1236380.1 N-acetylglucosamine transport system permease protein [Paenibacillus sp. SORGH_AS_0306]MDR6108733.1 N-acetylglucosamine transport system permease protein [Paenibacillus sp. SORGH_AS_0338]WCT55809.1 carbohydrate ABC transporter permease [Paenibacillus kyungheensis]